MREAWVNRLTYDERVVGVVTHMVYKTVFWCIVLRFQGAEKSLFCTENLDGTGRMLGQTEQTACVANKTCADEFSDKGGQVGRNSIHSIP